MDAKKTLPPTVSGGPDYTPTNIDAASFNQAAVQREFFAGDERTQWERMTAGDWYVADDPRMGQIHQESMRLSGQYNATYYTDPAAARPLLARIFGKIGQDVEIRPPFQVDYGKFTSIGEHVFINCGFTCLDVAPVVIGDYCQIGPNVQLLTPVHPLDSRLRAAAIEGAKPITLGQNVWLGGGVIVCPGVTIGEHCVIGAGAVVTKDIPPYSLAVGNPARVIRQLS